MSGGHGKPRWKTLMISNDAICVQAKGGEDSNIEGINILEVDDYLYGVHHVWWCVNPAFATYKWPQLGEGTIDVVYGMDMPLV